MILQPLSLFSNIHKLIRVFLVKSSIDLLGITCRPWMMTYYSIVLGTRRDPASLSRGKTVIRSSQSATTVLAGNSLTSPIHSVIGIRNSCIFSRA